MVVIIPQSFSITHFQSSYDPSGRYRRTISGILFCASSFIAISSGSDSCGSSGTNTGAFILLRADSQHSSEIKVGKRTATAHLICNALVPKILAFSYFVMKGVVYRSLFGVW